MATSVLVPSPARWRLLRALGLPVSHSYIAPKCFFGGRNITIAEGVSINYEVFFDGTASITVGKGAAIGARSLLLTATHSIGDRTRRCGWDVIAEPILVGEGAWLGVGVIVLPGVTIGDGCVVAAGSVVTRSCSPNGLYGGTPAVRIRDLATASPDGGLDDREAQPDGAAGTVHPERVG